MADKAQFGVPPSTREPSTHEPSGQRSESGQALKDEARHAWDSTRTSAREEAQKRQRATAAEVSDIADALRYAAGHLEGRNRPSTARLAERAAADLDRVADHLHRKSPDAMLNDLQAFARREPGLFLGAAVAAGFLAVRLLGGGTHREQTDAPQTQATPPDGDPASYPEGGHLH